MNCPHCFAALDVDFQFVGSWQDRDGDWRITAADCPSCGRVVMLLSNVIGLPDYPTILSRTFIRPSAHDVRHSPAPEVPEPFASEYRQAAAVLRASPKASAALSRRCLQAVLRDVGGYVASDLNAQILLAIDGTALPSNVADELHTLRVVRNFAAHPLKTRTGEIIDVDWAEAESQLKTLEALFDFYFVRRARSLRIKQSLNAKLVDVGKPTLK